MTETMVSNPRNFKAFVWHGLFLAFATTFTEINTVLPALVVQAGGTVFQVAAGVLLLVALPVIGKLDCPVERAL